ncbi:hypothetical protein K435DRAFT_974716 [Dendrothele bispora CBS 962.96]|uniref:Clp1-like protein n=1 Tax=Dendrothele bispora (strain CBS 962.96) TaxID=1314807 RepID=A0A4V4HAJ3_DENBC|nr:hypothetical protein K435DRAFT_974716 [Dendrothele bispora CBS 962.96]
MHSHARHESVASNHPTLQLPRKLARPGDTEVSKAAIMSVAPELANVPLEYIRQILGSKEAEMTAGLKALEPSHIPEYLPKIHLPSHLAISLPQSSPSSSVVPAYPTHALAVYSSRSNSPDSDQALIIPIHSLVLAAHCASLPTGSLSLSKPYESSSSSPVQIPVVPISLPSPHVFPIICKFLYTHSLESVLRSLVPLPSPDHYPFLQSPSRETVRQMMNSHSTLSQLAKHLCEHTNYNMRTLTTDAAHVKDVWQDVVALGVNDVALWDALDFAWEIVLGAMNICAAGAGQ